MNSVRKQRGAILILAAIIIPILIGMTALALDIGRLISVRSEMQNAADAAALAAAAELDGTSGALDRARSAARELLEHDSRFAKQAELLGATGVPDGAFTFYCIIGSKFDPAFDIGYCDDTPDLANPGRYLASTDQRAHYVRINLDPALANGRFSLDLFFLPVLSVLGVQTASVASVAASALGGRNLYFCDTAPMALCDPFEGTGRTFAEAMTPGQSIQLKQQGANTWSSGNFGFATPFYGGAGAGDTASYLADEYASGSTPTCSPASITTQPGNIAQKVKAAFNTRFDQYGPPNPYNQISAPITWPPAKNVVEYSVDTNAHPFTLDNRFGGGAWDFDAYWALSHPALAAPNAWSNGNRPTRKAVYDWEIANNQVPVLGVPIHIPRVTPDRRVVRVAVLSCNAVGLNGGKSTVKIFPPDGVATVFLIKQAGQPSGPNKVDMYAEYIGWESLGGGGDNHVQIQLFD